MMVNDATVLIVDDEPELLEIFSIWLKRGGANVLTAPNGAEGLKLLTSHKVHALISDIRMPIMDGVTLVKRLHDMQLVIPSIIFVSGFGDVDPRALYAMGVEAMLPKPLGRNQLLDTLALSLREREELWLTEPAMPSHTRIEVELPAPGTAGEDAAFSLGRGGCCFSYAKALPECTVDLYLSFADEPNTLEGQGHVRWYDSKAKKVGVEFAYIAPPSRPWLVDRLRAQETAGVMRSFIPFS